MPGQEAADLAGLRADAVGVGLDADRGAEPGSDPLDELADGDVFAPAHVDDPAEGGVAAGDGDEAGDGVLDVGPVAARVQAPERTLGRVRAWLMIVGMGSRGPTGAGRTC